MADIVERARQRLQVLEKEAKGLREFVDEADRLDGILSNEAGSTDAEKPATKSVTRVRSSSLSGFGRMR